MNTERRVRGGDSSRHVPGGPSNNRLPEDEVEDALNSRDSYFLAFLIAFFSYKRVGFLPTLCKTGL